MTDGEIAFDYHGCSARSRLLTHHRRKWSARHPGWDCVIEPVDFDLLDTKALNARKMLGADQYLFDAVARAAKFIAGIDHRSAVARVAKALSTSALHGGRQLASE